MPTSKQIVVTNATNTLRVCGGALLADTFRLRLVGLLGKKGIEQNSGLLIKPSSGIHTFGMSFPIDVVALDKKNRVIGAWSNVGPWRVRGLSLRTHSVLELAAGQIDLCKIAAGDQLTVEASV